MGLKESQTTLAERVVHWQALHGRNELPWQGTRDPYRVWLSEVMLQQTQVSTVLAYFSRFIDRLPTVADLARASEDEVFGLWSGLGYYSRARNLHRCAQDVVSVWGGRFPQTAQALQTLPGIGRSTASAIASLCFGERVAILDANVKRVLTRVLAFDADLSVAGNERSLWSLAEQVLPTQDLASAMPRYTQGMMDLGALVCSPKRPSCMVCPVAEMCEGRLQGRPEDFPLRTRKLKRSAQSVWLLWAENREAAVWLQKRPATGVWAGLYCLPWFDSAEQLVHTLPERQAAHARHLEPIKHVLTHKDLYLHPVRVTVPADALDADKGLWVAPSRWPALGLPAPIRQLLVQACSHPNDVVG